MSWLDVLPDGRLVTVATNSSGQRVLRTVDPNNGRTTDRALPSGARWLGAASAPNGAVAGIASKDGCCGGSPDPSELLVLEADGRQQRRRLSLPERDRTPATPPTISWGASGLIAIAASRPEPIAAAYYEGRVAPERVNRHPGWTDVLEPASGRLVASLHGWPGLAWSPDGKGLLAAQRDGLRQSRLAVFWGSQLEHRIDLGTTPLPVTPVRWRSHDG